VITQGKQIVSGHRRWLAAKDAGLDTVPVRFAEFDNDLAEREGELESLGRVKTKELILHIETGQEGEEYQVVEPWGEASFYSVRWSTLEELGIGVRYKKPYQNHTQSGGPASQVGLGVFITDGDHQ